MTASGSATLTVASPGAGAVVSLDFAGASFVFRQSDGIEADQYNDPLGRFRQRNIVATNSALPCVYVMFRPDVGSAREEIVVHLGDPLRAPVTIASTSAGPITTITTTDPHGLMSGASAVINNLAFASAWDTAGNPTAWTSVGKRQVTVTTPTTITIGLDTSHGLRRSDGTKPATLGPWDLPAYKTRITRANGATVAQDAALGHNWDARWRWQSEPRPARRTAAELMQLGLVPNIHPAGLTATPTPLPSPYAPMALCGIPANQGQTGGYPGLGYITGWQGRWLATPGADENLWRWQAEASASFQWCQRDPKTGAPLSLDTYPNATLYPNTGTPFVPRTQANTPDSGHSPSLSFVPFMLTGDPFHLEQLQYHCNHMQLAMPGNTGRISGTGRYYAWPLRCVGQLVIAMPDTVPSWMLPKAYFVRWLDRFRAVAEAAMNDTTDPWHTVFHLMPDSGPSNAADPPGSGAHIWQDSMISLTLCQLVLAGRTEFRQAATWKIGHDIARASATSGYMRAHPAPYHYRLLPASVLATALDINATTIDLQYADVFAPGMAVRVDSEVMTLVSVTANGQDWQVTRPQPRVHSVGAPVIGPKLTTWSMAQASNNLTKPANWLPPSTPDTLYVPASGQLDPTYIGYQLASLASAMDLQLPAAGLVDSYQWLNTQLRNTIAAGKAWGLTENWCVTPR